jgi:hypothetical protein
MVASEKKISLREDGVELGTNVGLGWGIWH